MEEANERERERNEKKEMPNGRGQKKDEGEEVREEQ